MEILCQNPRKVCTFLFSLSHWPFSLSSPFPSPSPQSPTPCHYITSLHPQTITRRGDPRSHFKYSTFLVRFSLSPSLPLSRPLSLSLSSPLSPSLSWVRWLQLQKTSIWLCLRAPALSRTDRGLGREDCRISSWTQWKDNTRGRIPATC